MRLAGASSCVVLKAEAPDLNLVGVNESMYIVIFKNKWETSQMRARIVCVTK